MFSWCVFYNGQIDQTPKWHPYPKYPLTPLKNLTLNSLHWLQIQHLQYRYTPHFIAVLYCSCIINFKHSSSYTLDALGVHFHERTIDHILPLFTVFASHMCYTIKFYIINPWVFFLKKKYFYFHFRNPSTSVGATS